MAVKTNAYLRGRHSAEQIARVITNEYGSETSINLGSMDTAWILFREAASRGADRSGAAGAARELFHCYTETNEETGEEGVWTYVSLGAYGDALPIIRLLAEHFGGTLVTNDHDGEAIDITLSGHRKMVLMADMAAA